MKYVRCYYGIDEEIEETVLSYLDEYLLDIAEKFTDKFVEKEV